MNVYASWNGATEVASWEVLAGSAPTALTPVRTSARTSFETRIPVGVTARYVAVRALDAAGRRARHLAGAARRQLSRYGHLAVLALAAAQSLDLEAELVGDGGVARVGVARAQLVRGRAAGRRARAPRRAT